MNYETSDYVEVRREDGGRRIYSRCSRNSTSWRSDGILYRNQKDAETIARLIAKACYAEDLSAQKMAADLS